MRAKFRIQTQAPFAGGGQKPDGRRLTPRAQPAPGRVPGSQKAFAKPRQRTQGQEEAETEAAAPSGPPPGLQPRGPHLACRQGLFLSCAAWWVTSVLGEVGTPRPARLGAFLGSMVRGLRLLGLTPCTAWAPHSCRDSAHRTQGQRELAAPSRLARPLPRASQVWPLARPAVQTWTGRSPSAWSSGGGRGAGWARL